MKKCNGLWWLLTEEFLDPDYPRRATTTAWAQAVGLEAAGSYGNGWCYTLNFRKPALSV
ncbi:MAG TPA: hypothetical protein PKH77_15245 [Anaerolineae bacterium]|nr:hypothetical protein [Anaerolineae bacterium]